jgi:hypothetical protein
MSNFLDASDKVRDAIKAWPKKKKENTPWIKEFAEGLRKLRDDFEEIVRADPACLYQPAHSTALEFHKSLAFIRYFRGGNRISKSQSGVIDDYWVLTGQHPYRPKPPLPTAVFVVGVDYAKYAKGVFEKKFITGEPSNPLSPIFPEGGKWLHHYESRRHIITLACPECANVGKASTCPHPKSTLYLYSDERSEDVLQGTTYAQGHFDEQIGENYFSESLERLSNIPHSGLIVTETPRKGKGFWTHQRLTLEAERGVKRANSDVPLITVHTIDQFKAGLTPRNVILDKMATYTPSEIQCRIYGLPVVDSQKAVFDLVELMKMREETKDPILGNLTVSGSGDDPLFENLDECEIGFEECEEGSLRVWDFPTSGAQYLIGVDVAQGLTKRDYSCASVVEIIPSTSGFFFKLVAQYHGWINPVPYANILAALGKFYNEAQLIVERNGPGYSTIHQLVEMGCGYLYRDTKSPAQTDIGFETQFGVVTSVANKGAMISMLQKCIKDHKTGQRSIIIPCEKTIDELESYIQESSLNSQFFKFQADGGGHDDRVMSLALLIYVAFVCPEIFDFDRAVQEKQQQYQANLDDRSRSFWDAIHKEGT